MKKREIIELLDGIWVYSDEMLEEIPQVYVNFMK